MEFSQEWIKNKLTELLGGSNIAEIAATVVLLVVTLLFYSLNWLAKLVLLMLAVNTTFAYFDWTRNAAMATFGYVGEIIMALVTSLVAYLPNLVVIVVVLFIARFVIHVTRLVFDGLRKERIRVPHFFPEWSVTSFNLIRLMIIVITLIIIFPYLPGSDSPAFQGLSIFFGVLVSLGSSSTVANVNVCTREASGKQSIYSDLHANIQDCFHGADVEILSPHYRATRDGNERAIPKGTT